MGNHLDDLLEEFSEAKLSQPPEVVLESLNDFIDVAESTDLSEIDDLRTAFIDALKHAHCEYMPQDYTSLMQKVDDILSEHANIMRTDNILHAARELS